MRRTLLLVDDEPSMLAALRRELRGHNFELLTASDGPTALKLLAEHEVQVIVSDYRMPEMNGVELLAEARRRHPETVRMVLSGFADFEAVVGAINLGHIYKFLGKPWDSVVLRDAVNDAFARYEMVRRSNQFSRVFDHTQEGIFILDAEACIETANPAFAAMVGLAPDALSGRPYRSLLDPQVEGEEMSTLLAGASSSEHWRGDLWQQRANGEIFPAAVTLSAMRNANGQVTQYVGLCVDITERKQREMALRESEKRFRDFMEFAPIGMVIVGLDGQLLRVNKMLCTILGFSREELETMHFEALTAPDDLAADLAMRRRLIDGELDVWKAEKRYLHKNGHSVWVQITAGVLRDSQSVPQCFDVQIEDISERRAQEEKIHQLAYYDALTGLPNRRLLQDRLEQALAQARRNGHLAALAFLDLDHFKQVNDVHGHDAGDLVLKEAAHRLAQSMRRGDTVARQGGDEFIVLLSEVGALDDIAIVGNKIVAALAAPYPLEALNLTIDVISTSVGFAVFPSHGVSAGELMKMADMAMYAAKSGGRNGWRLYDAAMAEADQTSR